MQAVVLIDAAPGFEDAVEAALKKVKGVAKIVRKKAGNYDLAILLDVVDAAELQQLVTGSVRTVTGIKGVEVVERPGRDLLAQLGGR